MRKDVLPGQYSNSTLAVLTGNPVTVTKVVARPQLSNRSWLRVPNSIHDNYCVKCVTGLKDFVHVSGKLESLNPSPVLSRKDLSVTSKSETVNLHVNSCVVNPVHFVKGYPQKKGVYPVHCQNYTEIKYVKDVSCVGHLSSVNLITSVPTIAPDLPVVARLHQFWEKWVTLPLRFQPILTRSPTITSCYVNPHKNLYLLEALHQQNKNAVEPVTTQKPLWFYNRLFLVPKPNNRWRPILDLST